MLWCDFHNKLKKLNRKLWVQVRHHSTHPHYPWIKIVGIHHGNRHICSATYDRYIPIKTTYENPGHVLRHQGLEDILKHFIRHEKNKQYNYKSFVKKAEIQRLFKINPHTIDTRK